MNSASRLELGWQPFFDQQVSWQEDACFLAARVFAHFGSHVLLQSEAGELTWPVERFCHPFAAGQAIGDDGDPSMAVGDWYLLDTLQQRSVRRLDRKSSIYRRAAGETAKAQWIAANVDTIFVVSSCNRDFNLSRLERYLALVLEAAARPVVVLTKSDLCQDAATYRQAAEGLYSGLQVATLDSRVEAQTSALQHWCCDGQTVALLGSSGVGKTTLANTLCGLDIKTAGIREDDAKGRHTTTARSMHRMQAGGWLVDNPGMRELQLPACQQGLADLFEDLLQIAKQCRFRDCRHRGDAGCALVAAVAAGGLSQRRLNNYLKLQAEQARNSASMAERRESERQAAKLYKRIISAKQRRRHG